MIRQFVHFGLMHLQEERTMTTLKQRLVGAEWKELDLSGDGGDFGGHVKYLHNKMWPYT
jgi:hypothetical protein